MLQYEGSIWRPPSEARSLILQATVGCSHNACIFCVSYKDKKFRVRGPDKIASDLSHLPTRYKQVTKRVFLADGDALAMQTAEMKKTLDVLYEGLPSLERVGVYAYAKNLRNKSVEDLRLLHKAGLGIVYYGLETGDDSLLRWARKGIDNSENIAACEKIRDARIPLSITIILGLAGEKRSRNHAIATAETLNAIDPEYVGALTLLTPRGTRIHEMVANGEFQPMDPFAILQELNVLITHLDLTECIFRTNHASNYLPLRGTLNRDKKQLLHVLDEALESRDSSLLRPSYRRGL